ncbi:hypothetical protein ACI77O_12320 [Pseudomonas tritici]|uniref:hypothetical protein n=1 Tax=Pseudomonas tritici TaxID=2745518 RepID=UPI00387B70D3
MSAWEASCRIQKVMQRDRYGCGVACAAMSAGQPYSVARKVFTDLGLAAKKRPFATNFAKLRLGLSALGVESELRRWSNWDALDGIGIVAVSTSLGPEYSNWHWVVAERHSEFGIVLHDPDYDLPSFSLASPEGVLSQPFAEYHPRKSWIRIAGQERSSVELL